MKRNKRHKPQQFLKPQGSQRCSTSVFLLLQSQRGASCSLHHECFPTVAACSSKCRGDAVQAHQVHVDVRPGRQDHVQFTHTHTHTHSSPRSRKGCLRKRGTRSRRCVHNNTQRHNNTHTHTHTHTLERNPGKTRKNAKLKNAGPTEITEASRQTAGAPTGGIRLQTSKRLTKRKIGITLAPALRKHSQARCPAAIPIATRDSAR